MFEHCLDPIGSSIAATNCSPKPATKSTAMSIAEIMTKSMLMATVEQISTASAD